MNWKRKGKSGDNDAGVNDGTFSHGLWILTAITAVAMLTATWLALVARRPQSV